MNARRARLVAIPFLLLAFGLRLVHDFWLRYVTGRPGALAIFAGAVLVPLGVYFLLCRGALRRPTMWRVDQGRFVVGASAIGTGLYAAPLGWLYAGLVETERVPGTNHGRLAPLDGFTTVTLVLGVVLPVLTIALLALDRPRLTLDAQGFTLLTPIGRRGARWDELLPGHPRPPAGRHLVAVDTLRQTASGPRRLRLPAARLDIDPALLAHTIRFYTDVPGARARIGTENGLPSWP